MGNSFTGETTRLIAFGGTEATGFLKLSLLVALATHLPSGEVRDA